MPAREEAKEAAHRGQMPGARGVAGTRRRLGRQPGAQVGGAQRCERREVRLATEVLGQETQEAGNVGAIGLHRQRGGATLPPEPFEEGNARFLAGHRRLSGA